jgi:hypothetical protein
MRSNFYQVNEEQRHGSYAVGPLWPLLALMFGGAWLAWPWSIVNAYALNSPTRKAEIAWAAAGLAGSVMIAVVILLWANSAADDDAAGVRLRYAMIGLTVWKLVCAYRVYLLQSRTVELFEFYGGQLRNALPIVLIAFFLRDMVLGAVPAVFLRLALM